MTNKKPIPVKQIVKDIMKDLAQKLHTTITKGVKMTPQQCKQECYDAYGPVLGAYIYHHYQERDGTVNFDLYGQDFQLLQTGFKLMTERRTKWAQA